MQNFEKDAETLEEFPSGTAPDISLQSRVARLLLSKLASECRSYCILTGYEELPDHFDSDIDFMVSTHDFERMPQLIERLAEATGTRMFQAIQHEVSARAFRLVGEADGVLSYIQPDSCSDYRHFGKLWLRADEMLASRRLHPNGFYIPGAAYEFIYYLIKRTNKRDITSVHGARLSKLYAEDSAGSDRLLQRFWGVKTAQSLSGMAATGVWEPLLANVEPYRAELRARASQGLAQKVSASFADGMHNLERVLQPTGAWIAFIGPDGCGKSSVIEGVLEQLAPAFQKVIRYHLRPKSLPARSNSVVAVTDPHGQAPRGYLPSIAKMLYLAADYWIGYWNGTRKATARTRLVVFDRYFYDILVDPKRVRYGGPAWLPHALAHFLPKPELVLLLNAPPEVLYARKQEVPYEEVVRQQKAYLDVVSTLSPVAVINSAQPLANVVHDACEAIVERLSARTLSRFNLAARPHAPLTASKR